MPDADVPSLLHERVMVVADHSRNLPRAIFVSPQVNELCLADRFGVFTARMVETMRTRLDGAVAFH